MNANLIHVWTEERVWMEFTTSLAFVQAFILDGDVNVRVFKLIKSSQV